MDMNRKIAMQIKELKADINDIIEIKAEIGTKGKVSVDHPTANLMTTTEAGPLIGNQMDIEEEITLRTIAIGKTDLTQITHTEVEVQVSTEIEMTQEREETDAQAGTETEDTQEVEKDDTPEKEGLVHANREQDGK